MTYKAKTTTRVKNGVEVSQRNFEIPVDVLDRIHARAQKYHHGNFTRAANELLEAGLAEIGD